MKCVIQRVSKAVIEVNNEIITKINKGLLVLVGYNKLDNEDIIRYVINKVINLRIFPDSNDKLNLSVSDINADILIVPNFTLYANTKHGRRPDFINCAGKDISEPLFEKTKTILSKSYKNVFYGIFGANMQINLINDGPLTVIVEK